MTELLQQVIAEIQKLPADQQDAIASRLMAELKASQLLENKYHNRQAFVLKIDKLRTRLLKTYGDFPDSVDLIREDRSR